MLRNFWFGFWLFMTTMVALAFVMRPDTVDGVLLYAGWMGAGVVFARPRWDEVVSWERELRESDTPFGYALAPLREGS